MFAIFVGGTICIDRLARAFFLSQSVAKKEPAILANALLFANAANQPRIFIACGALKLVRPVDFNREAISQAFRRSAGLVRIENARPTVRDARKSRIWLLICCADWDKTTDRAVACGLVAMAQIKKGSVFTDSTRACFGVAVLAVWIISAVRFHWRWGGQASAAKHRTGGREQWAGKHVNTLFRAY